MSTGHTIPQENRMSGWLTTMRGASATARRSMVSWKQGQSRRISGDFRIGSRQVPGATAFGANSRERGGPMMLAQQRIRPILVLIALIGMIAATLVVVRAQEASAFPGANGIIAFERNGAVWTMNADGTSPTLLRASAIDPAFSADGTKIAFTDTSTGDFIVHVMNADGTADTVLSSGTSDYNPAWSPDGAWIVFQRRGALTPPATGTASATDATGAVLTDTSSATPFANVRTGDTVTNTTTGESSTVLDKTDTTLTMATALPSGWTTGNAYAVTSEAERVWKINVATKTETKLSIAGPTHYYTDYSPAWSPDGTTIAYSTDRNTNDDIYLMGVAGETGGVTNLTPDVAAPPLEEWLDVAWDPAWSPDGTKIAFSSGLTATGGNSPENLWIMNADGTNRVNLTSVITVKDESPTWSPDGTMIAFERTMNLGLPTEDQDIYVVPAAGGSASPLTSGITNVDSVPDWQALLAGVADTYAIAEGGALTVSAPVGVLANDALLADSVGTATASLGTGPANGILSLAPDGSFTYTHDGSETTTDSFTYQPKQGLVTGAATTVTISITPINDAPVASNDGPYALVFGGSVSKSAPGVLKNDTDAEGDGLTATKITDPAHGTVSLNADGSFTYTHDSSTATTDSFTYQAKDSKGALSNIATVSFTVSEEPPTIKTHATGLVDPTSGKWYLYDDGGALVTSFFYGNPGDYPFMGDWDGDGVETPGLYRQSDGYVYLRNSNTVGIADIRFFFGNPGDVPIAGDFNGDGFDTVSIYRPSNQTFYIINELGANDGGLGAAEFSYVFGNPGDKPFVGDFNGNGIETVGLHRESTGLVYFRNTHTQGIADAQFIFGDPGDRLVAGDWTGDGVFTPALFRPSNTTMYFRHTNSQGIADNEFVPVPTNAGWLPVSGQR